jgi:hypothetical protein
LRRLKTDGAIQNMEDASFFAHLIVGFDATYLDNIPTVLASSLEGRHTPRPSVRRPFLIPAHRARYVTTHL